MTMGAAYPIRRIEGLRTNFENPQVRFDPQTVLYCGSSRRQARENGRSRFQVCSIFTFLISRKYFSWILTTFHGAALHCSWEPRARRGIATDCKKHKLSP